jgi:hypothetical protein
MPLLLGITMLRITHMPPTSTTMYHTHTTSTDLITHTTESTTARTHSNRRLTLCLMAS